MLPWLLVSGEVMLEVGVSWRSIHIFDITFLRVVEQRMKKCTHHTAEVCKWVLLWLGRHVVNLYQ